MALPLSKVVTSNTFRARYLANSLLTCSRRHSALLHQTKRRHTATAGNCVRHHKSTARSKSNLCCSLWVFGMLIVHVYVFESQHRNDSEQKNTSDRVACQGLHCMNVHAFRSHAADQGPDCLSTTPNRQSSVHGSDHAVGAWTRPLVRTLYASTAGQEGPYSTTSDAVLYYTFFTTKHD